jgi:hypothetical protein
MHSFSGVHPLNVHPRGPTAGFGITRGHNTSLTVNRGGKPHHATGSQVSTIRSATNGDTASGNRTIRSVSGTGRVAMLHNGSFAAKSNSKLTTGTFRGRFAAARWSHPGGWYWHKHRPIIIVIGWFGPLFWPFAYWDFIDYTFWPYAYDAFWPFAYDDLYWGWYGPYAYEGAAYASTPQRSGRRASRHRTIVSEVCTERVPALTDWPVDQITKTVEPNENQQAALKDLKETTAKAIEVLQAACPTDLPSTPTGRLEAMRRRVEAMLQATLLMHPALDRFYGSLDDEQKARFNVTTLQSPQARRGNSPDPAGVCNGEAANVATPKERLEQNLHLSESQRSDLDALNEATRKAADMLNAKCNSDEALTPPGRLAVMEERLNAMIEAIKVVQPALDTFYGALSVEQKARFNQLDARRS